MNATSDAPAVNDEIQELLRERLGRYGFERAVINAGSDHSGDPALFIDAFYHLTREPVQSIEMLHLLNELRNFLVRKGETRFPYLRHHFDERQQVTTRKPTARQK
jgi:hypothetical protein